MAQSITTEQELFTALSKISGGDCSDYQTQLESSNLQNTKQSTATWIHNRRVTTECRVDAVIKGKQMEYNIVIVRFPNLGSMYFCFEHWLNAYNHFVRLQGEFDFVEDVKSIS